LAFALRLRLGFGDLSSRDALAPSWFVSLYASSFAFAAVGFSTCSAHIEGPFAAVHWDELDHLRALLIPDRAGG
jgi:hypothetical protein